MDIPSGLDIKELLLIALKSKEYGSVIFNIMLGIFIAGFITGIISCLFVIGRGKKLK